MMKKGMFYLLPLLALTQIGASNATLQVGKDSLLTVKVPMIGTVVEHHGKDSPIVMNTLPRPLSGRNRIARGSLIASKPRAGRNVRRIAHGKKLLKRR
ncbi:hypothetical protein [Leucothrix arctica]|uniref:Uncharacterized protein n=1 Tax=Leucothrix arctica TaxID=1481894 RepID=A0A317CCB9_9GAMM|nr:hypothetical protein [Leucothrix arctica]PWQ96196.1 hypothetical protein DKT75_09380 [Leucothrix arctica]